MKRAVVVACALAAGCGARHRFGAHHHVAHVEAELVGCSLFTSLNGLQNGDSNESDSGGTNGPDAFASGDTSFVADGSQTDARAGDGGAVADGSAYRAAVLADSPIAYWRLGEKSGPILHDETAANDGSYSSTAAYAQAGALAGDPDTAVGCDETAPIASVPGDPFNFAGKSPLSIELWLKPTTTFDSNPYFIFSRETGGTGPTREGYDAFISADGLKFERITPGGNFEIVGIGSVPENVYSHFVYMFDGTTAHLYFNGSEVDSGAFTSSLPTITASLVLGYGGGSGFTGSLDEIAFYAHALTAARVLEHFRVGSGS